MEVIDTRDLEYNYFNQLNDNTMEFYGIRMIKEYKDIPANTRFVKAIIKMKEKQITLYKINSRIIKKVNAKDFF